MKKASVSLALIVTIMLIGACGMSEGKKNELDTSQNQITVESSLNSNDTKKNSAKDNASIFTGVLATDAELNDGSEKSIRLVLKDIEAISDPDGMEKTMKNDGVILNISENQLADGLTEANLKKGDKLKFSLNSMPVMTMSLPPQIPGMSIQLVEKNN